MAGRFLNSRYETIDGVIHPIRIQPETILGINPAPSGAVTNSMRARVSGSRRAYGLKARSITLSRPIGDNADYNGATVYVRIPILLESAWIAIAVASTITYQGVAWTVVSKSPESSR